MRSGTLFLAFISLAFAIASAQPTIVINTTQVRIAHTINVTNAATNTVVDSIMVLNGSNSSFTATVNPGAPWLLINGGTSATGQTPGNITIGYNPAELNAGLAMTPFQLYTALLAGTEFQNRSNHLYIKLLYFVILQRDSDPAGFNFWLNVANGGGPGIYFHSPATRLTILGDGQPGVGFLGSSEFQSLFQ